MDLLRKPTTAQVTEILNVELGRARIQDTIAVPLITNHGKESRYMNDGHEIGRAEL